MYWTGRGARWLGDGMNLTGTAALYAITWGSMSAFARPCGTLKRAPNACARAWPTPTDAFEILP